MMLMVMKIEPMNSVKEARGVSISRGGACLINLLCLHQRELNVLQKHLILYFKNVWYLLCKELMEKEQVLKRRDFCSIKYWFRGEQERWDVIVNLGMFQTVYSYKIQLQGKIA